MTEVEGENERLKVIIKQKEQEIFDNKKVSMSTVCSSVIKATSFVMY